MLNDKYKFYCSKDGIQTQVFPIQSTFIFSGKKEPRQRFIRKEVKDKFLFCKDDFWHFYNLEQSCDRCDDIRLEIYSLCGGVEELAFAGQVQFNQSDWNESKCEVNLQVIPEDEYSCLFEGWEDKKNILLIGDKTVICAKLGEFECPNPCTESIDINTSPPVEQIVPFSNCLTGAGWTLVRHSGTVDQVDGTIDRASTYCREVLTSAVPPPGDDWINEPVGSNTWVRGIPVVIDSENATPPNYLIVYAPAFPASGEFDNGVTLKNVLEFFAADCGLGVVSDLLNINPDSTAPVNIPYLCARPNLDCLTLYQVTDITNAGASENATVANKCLKEIVEDLLIDFNMEFWIENGNLRLEHISYSSQVQGLDLTQSKYQSCVKGRNNYTYGKDVVARVENFNFPYTVSPAFNGYPIVHPDCSDFNEKIDNNTKCITTDIQHLLQNKDSAPTDGVVMVSAVDFDGKKVLQVGADIPTFSGTYTNSALSWPVLHECYHLDGRLQFAGIMNGSIRNFDSVNRYKNQEPLTIPFQCEEFKTWNSDELIKTELGWGEVPSYEYDACTCYLTLNLAHDPNCNCFLPCDGIFTECDFPIWDAEPCSDGDPFAEWEVISLVIGSTTYIDNTNPRLITIACNTATFVNQTGVAGTFPRVIDHVNELQSIFANIGAPISVSFSPILERIVFKFPSCENWGLVIAPSGNNGQGDFASVNGMVYNQNGAVEGTVFGNIIQSTAPNFPYIWGEPTAQNCTTVNEC